MYGSVPKPTQRVLCHVQVSTNTHTKGSVPCTGQYQHPHKYTGQCQHPHTGFCAVYRSAPTPTQRVLCQVLTLTSQSYRLLVSMSPGCSCGTAAQETSLMPSCPWRGTGGQDLRCWGTGWSHNTALSPAESDCALRTKTGRGESRFKVSHECKSQSRETTHHFLKRKES